MIGYNRKSFIYMQPINDRMEFLGIDYNRKFILAAEFLCNVTPDVNFVQV